ncbi:MAG: Rieske 2Fe-2S domain-containing protein [Rickettsiales bacterium]
MPSTELIYNSWYVAAPSGKVARASMFPVTLLGQQLLLVRDNNGTVSALRDFCPHRGIPLRYGRYDGSEIECCYHGWCFASNGQCTKIPSLTDDDKVDISRVKAASFPCREENGVIWVYVLAPKTRTPETLPDLPELPGPENKPFYWVDSVNMPCNIDHAVIGLMDPSHGPYVHASWWWRSQRSMHVKQKQFAPTKLGFRMVAHKPSSNSRAYKILGGEPVTEIAFQLPSLRTEHITIGNNHIVLLTALTPTDEGSTTLHQFIFTNIRFVKMLLPILKPFGKAFIQQDVRIVEKQQEGLRGEHPALMLLGDADQQALWYHKIKREYLQSQAQNVAFENPLKEKLLRWRS